MPASKCATNGTAPAVQAVEGDDPDPAFDPFRRKDRYGTMGWAQQPWTEYARLALLSLTLLPFKALGALGAWTWCPCSVCLSSPTSKEAVHG